MPATRQYTIGQRMASFPKPILLRKYDANVPRWTQGLGFAGVLAIAGVTFYFAKQGINARRKAELDAYRAGAYLSACKGDPDADVAFLGFIQNVQRVLKRPLHQRGASRAQRCYLVCSKAGARVPYLLHICAFRQFSLLSHCLSAHVARSRWDPSYHASRSGGGDAVIRAWICVRRTCIV